MNRTIRRVVAVASATTVFVVGNAEAGNFGEVIGKESARGDYAFAIADGNARNPDALYVRVTSRPSQPITGNWFVVCSKGYGSGSKDGKFRGTTPEVDRIKLPMSNPDDCTVSGSAQLKESGKVTVKLFAR